MKHDVQLRLSHDAMARFLLSVVKHSDKHYKDRREPMAEKQYQQALKLLHKAGLKYEPPK